MKLSQSSQFSFSRHHWNRPELTTFNAVIRTAVTLFGQELPLFAQEPVLMPSLDLEFPTHHCHSARHSRPLHLVHRDVLSHTHAGNKGCGQRESKPTAGHLSSHRLRCAKPPNFSVQRVPTLVQQCFLLYFMWYCMYIGFVSVVPTLSS